MNRGETITENTAATARKAALEGIWERGGEVLYEDVAPHFIELFRAVAETGRPAMVLYKDKLLTCLVSAADVIEMDKYHSEVRGVDPIEFKDRVVDAREAMAAGPEDNAEGVFISLAAAMLGGGLAFFSVDDPGIPEVVMSDTRIIDGLAKFSDVRADMEAARRIEESEEDPAFLVPLPSELVEGIDLTQGPDGTTIVPRGHIAFVMEYEQLKEEAAADASGRKQAELDALVAGVRETLMGEVEGEPFRPTTR